MPTFEASAGKFTHLGYAHEMSTASADKFYRAQKDYTAHAFFLYK